MSLNSRLRNNSICELYYYSFREKKITVETKGSFQTSSKASRAPDCLVASRAQSSDPHLNEAALFHAVERIFVVVEHNRQFDL